MRNLGLATARKKGTQVYYAVTIEKFVEGYRMIREGLAELHLSNEVLLFPEDRAARNLKGR